MKYKTLFSMNDNNKTVVCFSFVRNYSDITILLSLLGLQVTYNYLLICHLHNVKISVIESKMTEKERMKHA